jgi:hypothetical protein
MQNNHGRDNSSHQSSFNLINKYITEKNVDRVRFVESSDYSISSNYSLFSVSALYELNKETKKKTGGLVLIQLDTLTKSMSLINKLDLPYGVLDFKYEDGTFFTANSNSSFSMVNTKFECVKNFEILSKDSECTLNTLDIKNLKYDSTILLSMNDGYHHIFDLNKECPVISKKSHDYGLWSCLILDQNTYLTGSEDSLMKMWDRRIEKSIGNNKTHTASVNCIYMDSLQDSTGNIVITGSYDENFTVIDLRKINETIIRQKINCSIWDINQVNFNNKKLLLMSCIYEGFNIFEYTSYYNIDLLLSSKIGDKYKNGDLLHNSIVYGLDSSFIDNQLYIATSSFYDNSVLFSYL